MSKVWTTTSEDWGDWKAHQPKRRKKRPKRPSTSPPTNRPRGLDWIGVLIAIIFFASIIPYLLMGVLLAATGILGERYPKNDDWRY